MFEGAMALEHLDTHAVTVQHKVNGLNVQGSSLFSEGQRT